MTDLQIIVAALNYAHQQSHCDCAIHVREEISRLMRKRDQPKPLDGWIIVDENDNVINCSILKVKPTYDLAPRTRFVHLREIVE